ncbi:MAG: hypothetical protein BHW12_02820 [Coprobacillus sp. 28_7]|nr:MAG: hypothetical protein BHW12_02820 [Coprobacillus sp. 28_7]
MMDDLNKLLNLEINNRLLSPIWKYVINDIISEEINCNDEDKNDLLIFFSVYFSLVDDGNVCISLNENIALNKWKEKYEFNRIVLESKDAFNKDDYDYIITCTEESISKAIKLINKGLINNLVGKKKFFDIENNYLYLKKYNIARKGIKETIDRLFKQSFNCTPYLDCQKDKDISIELSKGQAKVVDEGCSKNLIITGGPGTGKTTSILFLLINILNTYKDAGGIWHTDRFRPLVTAIANFGMNIIMVQFWGLYGIILSTVLSMFLIGMPWLFHNLFTTMFEKKHMKQYIYSIAFYAIVSIFAGVISVVICNFINFSLWRLFLLMLESSLWVIKTNYHLLSVELFLENY